MKRFILLYVLCLSLSVSADDNVIGGFVVAPICTDGGIAYGDCLSPNEIVTEDASYIAGKYSSIITAMTATDIKEVKNVERDNYYTLRGSLLTVNTVASLYTLDGKSIKYLKANTSIDLGSLPSLIILKFKDGMSFKILKTEYKN